jgi:hypothetical protein
MDLAQKMGRKDNDAFHLNESNTAQADDKGTQMRTINIKNKLTEMGVDLSSINMGDFDFIGEYTAKRQRTPDDPNFKKHGAFYRANYERGILIYYLIRLHNVQSVLEIGFGRGFATFCAAKAFYDVGIQGTIMTVDPVFDEKYLQALTQVFPKQYFDPVKFVKGPSQGVVPTLEGNFDLVYIDGDHSYEATKADWENTKDRYNKFLLFDDYHMSSKNDPGIQCSRLIDEIDDPSKELIILDRRMFFDDRQVPDDQVNYGQVLLTKPGTVDVEW